MRAGDPSHPTQPVPGEAPPSLAGGACPYCGRNGGHWSNCPGPLHEHGETIGRAITERWEEAEVEIISVPPMQGDKVRVPDGREGVCFSVSPGLDSEPREPWAFVHFSNEEELEPYALRDLIRT